jgi:hypothetical protein
MPAGPEAQAMRALACCWKLAYWEGVKRYNLGGDFDRPDFVLDLGEAYRLVGDRVSPSLSWSERFQVGDAARRLPDKEIRRMAQASKPLMDQLRAEYRLVREKRLADQRRRQAKHGRAKGYGDLGVR